MIIRSIDSVELYSKKNGKDAKSVPSKPKKNNDGTRFGDTFNCCIAELDKKEEYKN